MRPGITIQGSDVNVNFDELLAFADKGILRATAFMGFGLNASNSGLTDFHPAQAYVRLVPYELTSEQLDDYRSGFQDWVIHNAVRELVESFGLYLNTMYAACALFSSPGVPFDKIDERIKRFEQMGEKRRLDAFRSELAIDPPSFRYLSSLIEVRNEITHSWGIVRQDLLRLTWLKQQICLRGEDGSEHVLKPPLDEEFITKSPSRVLIQFVDGSREYKRGERISLSSIEAQEICFSNHGAVRELLRAVRVFAEKNGVMAT
jgi:hypothetical protein